MNKPQRTLLVVEDSLEDIDAIARTLRNVGGIAYRLLTALSAQEASGVLAAEAVDCVLLDYALPGADGLEVLGKMPREGDKTAIPVIMLTGLGSEEVAVEAMKSGAWDYLVKHVDGRHLKMLPSLIDRVIREHDALVDKRRAEERLRLAASVIDNIIEGVFVTDAEGAIVSTNPAFSAITGYSREEVLGKDPRILKSFRHGATFYRGMWTTISQHGCWQGEFWNRRKNGEAFLSRQTVTAILDSNDKPTNYVSVFSDVTEIKRQEERIQHQAYHDALTGLPNRLLFHDRLDRLLTQARRSSQIAAVLFLDLDHFKEVNDTLGHDVGDLLLQEVAKRLTGCVRDSDTVSRLGGDEFTLILSEVKHVADVAAISEKILTELKRPFSLAGHELYISGSIGISLFPGDGQNVHDLMKNADAAMYLAKKLGRQGYQFYTDDMTATAAKLLDIETSLRRALDKKQFFLLFQPQFDMQSRKLTCIEALLRWQHPTQGVLLPQKFLPAAERNGLIVQIGEWVLRTACAQSKAWQDEGLFVPVSVNLSASQLHHESLLQMVADVLRETGLEPHHLELEVAEGAIMARPDETMVILQDLKRMGVRLSIDNFGSALCSLRHLKQLPIDKLKIDRSFIQNLPGNTVDAAMAVSVINMSHNLCLQVVAEGVEMAGQASFLRDNGCDQFQGYYCSNPLLGKDIRELLQCGVA